MITSKQIANALRKANVKVTSTEIDYLYTYAQIDGEYMKARPIRQVGQSYSSNKEFRYKCILNDMGVTYTFGNDAARGGKLGNFVGYLISEFHASLKTLTGIDVPAIFVNEQTKKEIAAAVEQEKKDAIIAEANTIKCDDTFFEQVTTAENFIGENKSKAMAYAMKTLLERNGIQKIKTDFWQVFRILKGRAKK